MINVYTKDNCVFCTRTKTLLANRKITFNEYILNVDISLEEIRRSFPTMKTFPIIVIDNEVIGGYTELVEKISDEFFGQKLLNG